MASDGEDPGTLTYYLRQSRVRHDENCERASAARARGATDELEYLPSDWRDACDPSVAMPLPEVIELATAPGLGQRAPRDQGAGPSDAADYV